MNPEHTPLFPAEFLESVNTHSLTGVRAGGPERDFLEIWVVQVEGRLFARSWGLARRSWYTACLEGVEGELQSGGRCIAVRGIVPEDLDRMTAAISAEYLRRYNQGDNAVYAQGIAGPEHVARTLEFVPVHPR